MKIRVIYTLWKYFYYLNDRLLLSHVFSLFNFYGDAVLFVTPSLSWFTHGGRWSNGILSGSLAFGWANGEVHLADGGRLVSYKITIIYRMFSVHLVTDSYYRNR